MELNNTEAGNGESKNVTAGFLVGHMEVSNKDVGARIKSIRQKLGKTTKEFGSLVGNASDSLVSRWERGVNLPNNKRIKAIASIGGISVSELLYGPFERFVRNYAEEVTYDEDWETIFQLEDYDRKEIIDVAISQLLKKTDALSQYEKGEFETVRYNLYGEVLSAAARKSSGTEFTNRGAITSSTTFLSSALKDLEEYHDNGVDENIYHDIKSTLTNASEKIQSLYDKYSDKLN